MLLGSVHIWTGQAVSRGCESQSTRGPASKPGHDKAPTRERCGTSSLSGPVWRWAVLSHGRARIRDTQQSDGGSASAHHGRRATQQRDAVRLARRWASPLAHRLAVSSCASPLVRHPRLCTRASDRRTCSRDRHGSLRQAGQYPSPAGPVRPSNVTRGPLAHPDRCASRGGPVRWPRRTGALAEPDRCASRAGPGR